MTFRQGNMQYNKNVELLTKSLIITEIIENYGNDINHDTKRI